MQAQFTSGVPAFVIVGLPDKAIKEAGERVACRAGVVRLNLPPKRVVVNLAPADLPGRAAITICRSRWR